MGKGTIVLAYSGGLDTSICIPLLRERYDYDRVVTVAVNVGQSDAEIDMATQKGKKLSEYQEKVLSLMEHLPVNEQKFLYKTTKELYNNTRLSERN